METVNIWQLVKYFSADLDLSQQQHEGEGRVLVAGKYLLPANMMLEIEDEEAEEEETIRYPLEVLVLFVKFRASSHSLYVKKVSISITNVSTSILFLTVAIKKFPEITLFCPMYDCLVYRLT